MKKRNDWWWPGQGLGSAVAVPNPQPSNYVTDESADVVRSTSLRMDPSPGDRYNSPRQDDFSVPVRLQAVRGYDVRRVGLTSMGADTPLPSLNRWNQIKLGSVFHRQAPQRWSSAAKNPGYPGFVDDGTQDSRERMADPHDLATPVFFAQTGSVTEGSFRTAPGIGTQDGQVRVGMRPDIGGS